MGKAIKYLKDKDIDLLFFFNNSKVERKLIDRIMKFITYFGSFSFAMLLLVVLLLTNDSEYISLGIHLAIGLFISSTIVLLIKNTIKRPRPFEILEDIKTILIPRDKNSFPSGHTCAAMTMSMIISQSISSIASAIVIALSVLVGISRMYLGVHYPSDVVFGGVIAFLTVSIIVPIIA